MVIQSILLKLYRQILLLLPLVQVFPLPPSSSTDAVSPDLPASSPPLQDTRACKILKKSEITSSRLITKPAKLVDNLMRTQVKTYLILINFLNGVS